MRTINWHSRKMSKSTARFFFVVFSFYCCVPHSMSAAISLPQASSGEALERRLDKAALTAQKTGIQKLRELTTHAKWKNEPLVHLRTIEAVVAASEIQFRISSENGRSDAYLSREQKKYQELLLEVVRRSLDMERRFQSFSELDRVVYLRAKAHDELEQKLLAHEAYLLLISKFPTSSLVMQSRLAASQYLFDQEKFAPILPLLDPLVQNRAEGELSAHAQYRVAWCQYNLKDYESALDSLSNLIHWTMESSEVESELLQSSRLDFAHFAAEGLSSKHLEWNPKVWLEKFNSLGGSRFGKMIYRAAAVFRQEKNWTRMQDWVKYVSTEVSNPPDEVFSTLGLLMESDFIEKRFSEYLSHLSWTLTWVREYRKVDSSASQEFVRARSKELEQVRTWIFANQNHSQISTQFAELLALHQQLHKALVSFVPQVSPEHYALELNAGELEFALKRYADALPFYESAIIATNKMQEAQDAEKRWFGAMNSLWIESKTPSQGFHPVDWRKVSSVPHRSSNQETESAVERKAWAQIRDRASDRYQSWSGDAKIYIEQQLWDIHRLWYRDISPAEAWAWIRQCGDHCEKSEIRRAAQIFSIDQLTLHESWDELSAALFGWGFAPDSKVASALSWQDEDRSKFRALWIASECRRAELLLASKNLLQAESIILKVPRLESSDAQRIYVRFQLASGRKDQALLELREMEKRSDFESKKFALSIQFELAYASGDWAQSVSVAQKIITLSMDSKNVLARKPASKSNVENKASKSKKLEIVKDTQATIAPDTLDYYRQFVVAEFGSNAFASLHCERANNSEVCANLQMLQGQGTMTHSLSDAIEKLSRLPTWWRKAFAPQWARQIQLRLETEASSLREKKIMLADPFLLKKYLKRLTQFERNASSLFQLGFSRVDSMNWKFAFESAIENTIYNVQAMRLSSQWSVEDRSAIESTVSSVVQDLQTRKKQLSEQFVVEPLEEAHATDGLLSVVELHDAAEKVQSPWMKEVALAGQQNHPSKQWFLQELMIASTAQSNEKK